MSNSFKDIARNKQARYFENNHGVKEYSTIKRKPRGYTEPIDFYVEALLKWDDAKDGIIFYEGYRKQILNEIFRLRKAGIYTPSGMMMRHSHSQMKRRIMPGMSSILLLETFHLFSLKSRKSKQSRLNMLPRMNKPLKSHTLSAILTTEHHLTLI